MGEVEHGMGMRKHAMVACGHAVLAAREPANPGLEGTSGAHQPGFAWHMDTAPAAQGSNPMDFACCEGEVGEFVAAMSFAPQPVGCGDEGTASPAHGKPISFS